MLQLSVSYLPALSVRMCDMSCVLGGGWGVGGY